MKYSMDVLIRKVGGRFRLVSLVQKRIRQLQRGYAPLVTANLKDMKISDLKEVVFEELMQDKITFRTDGEVVEKV